MRRAPARLFRPRPLAFAVAWVLLGAAVFAQGSRPLTFVDLMKMRTIDDPVIAENGDWVAYQAKPDRGDGVAIVRATASDTTYEVARGMAPIISSDGRFVAVRVAPSVADAHAAKDEPKDKHPQPGATLLSTQDGTTTTWDRVQSLAFSNDAAWLAVHHHPPLDDPADDSDGELEAAATAESTTKEPTSEEPVTGAPEAEASEAATSVATQPIEGTEAPSVPGAETPSIEEAGAEATAESEDENTEDAERVGTTLTLVDLDQTPEATSDAREAHTIEHVEAFAFDESGRYLAYTVATPQGANGVFLLDLATPDTQPHALHEIQQGRYTALSWAQDVTRLGFVVAVDDTDGEPGDAAVWAWSADAEAATERVASSQVGEGWRVPSINALTWSRDGARLFFGRKPAPIKEDDAGDDAPLGDGANPEENSEDTDDTEEETPYDPYDVEALLADRGVDVWHWNDPRIIPNQKEMWEESEKDRTYRAVLHHADGRVVLLADEGIPDIATDDGGVTANLDNPHAVLAFADTPYLKEITWDGFHQDVYRQSLTDGERQRVVARLRNAGGNVALSPDGRFVVYYQTPHWYLYDGENASTRNLTEGLDVPFDDEDHDYPQPAPGYDLGGWVAATVDGPVEAVLIHDKYDIWSFALDDRHDGEEAVSLTNGQGRRDQTLFRVQDVDDEQPVFLADERLLVTGYRDRSKSWGFYGVRPDRAGVETLMAGDYKLEIIAKAKHADQLLFTRERYDEFPDLRVAELDFKAPKRLSDLNPQIADFAWGEAELVSWQSADGLPLDGVLIKPGNYQPGQRYPVLVYYYRFFSQRLHSFNQPVINHRPSFPLYASNGYAVFLPDIRFEVGRPGPAAVKSLLPGVQKLIEMGIADPDAIGLHGHSWSGYQTAYVVTQTNRFAAAVAGAPVSNMTSAYGGIRWGSGLSRQFQYEQSQSRLGASLWEGRDRYIDNSPVFFADRIETPLLIMFGDEDEAVPWYQGIELYMALRRLEKDAVFLQYRGEGHHPKQYPNKLDYSIKMKEYFDHYLKGEPAADWITHGVPYRGE